MNIQQHNPLHPGEFIQRVYMEPFDIGSNELARRLKVSTGTVSKLLNKQSALSPTMALKLSKVLGRSPESWMLMQDNYDLAQASKSLDLSQYETIRFA